MAWSQRFIDALSARNPTPVWELRGVATPLAPLSFVPSGTAYSSQASAARPAILTPEELRISSDGVEPVTWAPSWGGWALSMATPDPVAFTLLRRGFIYQLYMGFAGWASADFEPIAIGVFQNASRRGAGAWTLQFSGLGYMLASRMEQDGDRGPLFYDVGSTTTIDTTAYVAGDATIRVAATSAFARETGGSYLIKVAGSGGDFYLSASGTATAPIRFTGLSATGQLGTTASNAAAGSAVTEVGWIPDHPIDIATKVLTSTGLGTNGSDDTLPASWGLALPVGLLDAADISRTRAGVQPSSGSYVVDATAEAEQTNPLTWLLTYLTPLGIWPVTRQGLITLRAAFHPFASNTFQPPWPIDDRHIVPGSIEQSFYSASAPVEFEYAGVALSDNPAGTLYADNPPSTRPVREYFPYEPPGTYTNTAAVKAEIANRMRYWPTRPWEPISFTLAGLWAMQLCPGDLVSLTTSQTFRRPRLLNSDNRISNYAGLVIGVSPDFRAASVRLDVAFLPDTAD